jgi:hypothetical protein
VTDRLGARLGTFCALAPLADPDAARAELERWPAGAASPLAAVPRTHFARFVVLPEPPREVADQPDDPVGGPLLMLSAFCDGDPLAWLDGLCAAVPSELSWVLASCTGAPGPGGMRAWLAARRVPAAAIFGAYPDASVEDVRAALAFRERLRAFAFELEERRSGQAAFRAFAEEAS